VIGFIIGKYFKKIIKNKKTCLCLFIIKVKLFKHGISNHFSDDLKYIKIEL